MEKDMYARLYATLCGAASDAIELIDAGKTIEARRLLQITLTQAEEYYVQNTPSDVPESTIIPFPKSNYKE